MAASSSSASVSASPTASASGSLSPPPSEDSLRQRRVAACLAMLAAPASPSAPRPSIRSAARAYNLPKSTVHRLLQQARGASPTKRRRAARMTVAQDHSSEQYHQSRQVQHQLGPQGISLPSDRNVPQSQLSEHSCEQSPVPPLNKSALNFILSPMTPQEENAEDESLFRRVTPDQCRGGNCGTKRAKRRATTTLEESYPAKKVRYSDRSSDLDLYRLTSPSYHAVPSAWSNCSSRIVATKSIDSPASLDDVDVGTSRNLESLPLPPAASLPFVVSSRRNCGALSNSYSPVYALTRSLSSQSPRNSCSVSLLQSMRPKLFPNDGAYSQTLEMYQTRKSPSLDHCPAPTMSHLTTSLESAGADALGTTGHLDGDSVTRQEYFHSSFSYAGFKSASSSNRIALPRLNSPARAMDAPKQTFVSIGESAMGFDEGNDQNVELSKECSSLTSPSQIGPTEETSRPNAPPSHVLDPAWALMSLTQRPTSRCSA